VQQRWEALYKKKANEASGSVIARCCARAFADGTAETESLWLEIEDEEFAGLLLV
jgi:hypothetical protein